MFEIIVMPQSEGKILGYYYDGEFDGANNLTELQKKIKDNTLVMVTSGITFGANKGNVDVYTWLNNNSALDKTIMNVKFFHRQQ